MVIIFFFYSKVDPELLPRIVDILNTMLVDENVAVIKKLILSLSALYKAAFRVGFF